MLGEGIISWSWRSREVQGGSRDEEEDEGRFNDIICIGKRKGKCKGMKEKREGGKKHSSDRRRRDLGGHNHYQFGMPRARQRLGSTQRIEQTRDDHFNTFPSAGTFGVGEGVRETTKSSEEPRRYA